MYREWINKSVSKTIADEVFLYENKQILGIVTLKLKENIATIGLIAVAENQQGKGIGRKLVDACMDFCQKNNIKKIEVATQKANLQACNFYEKYGFSVKEITPIYHFWL